MWAQHPGSVSSWGRRRCETRENKQKTEIQRQMAQVTQIRLDLFVQRSRSHRSKRKKWKFVVEQARAAAAARNTISVWYGSHYCINFITFWLQISNRRRCENVFSSTQFSIHISHAAKTVFFFSHLFLLLLFIKLSDAIEWNSNNIVFN